EVLEIDVSRVALVKGHHAPFDYLSHAFLDLGKIHDCIVWAARGGGKTFLGALATLLDMIFKPGIQVRILAGSREQGQHMYEHLRRLFETPALAGVRHTATKDRVELPGRGSAV